MATREPFDAASDDWNDYVKRFKHFFLANGVTENTQKLHLFLTLQGWIQGGQCPPPLPPKSRGPTPAKNAYEIYLV